MKLIDDVRLKFSAEIADHKISREVQLRRTDPAAAFEARQTDVIARCKKRDRHRPQIYCQCRYQYNRRYLRRKLTDADQE